MRKEETNKVVFTIDEYSELMKTFRNTHEDNLRLREDNLRLRETVIRLENEVYNLSRKVDNLTKMVEKLVIDKMENSGINP